MLMTLSSAEARASKRSASGARLPPNAQLVLDALREESRPIKAYALLGRLQTRGINAPMTIYRALERLIAGGYARKIESLNAFIALPVPTAAPVAFVICRECGSTRTESVNDATMEWLTSVGIDAGAAYIEAYSSCDGCDDANRRQVG